MIINCYHLGTTVKYFRAWYLVHAVHSISSWTICVWSRCFARSSAVFPCTANNQISTTKTNTAPSASTHLVALGVDIGTCVHQDFDNLGVALGCSNLNGCGRPLCTSPLAPALPASTHRVALGVDICICVHQDLGNLGVTLACSPKECGPSLHPAPSAPAPYVLSGMTVSSPVSLQETPPPLSRARAASTTRLRPPSRLAHAHDSCAFRAHRVARCWGSSLRPPSRSALGRGSAPPSPHRNGAPVGALRRTVGAHSYMDPKAEMRPCASAVTL